MLSTTTHISFAFLLSVALLLSLIPHTHAVKFNLHAAKRPPAKCIWNTAHTGQLLIATANVGPGDGQRVDIEIVDSGAHRNVYLSKRDVKGETRFAVTAHADGDVGVCFRNYLEKCALLSCLVS